MKTKDIAKNYGVDITQFETWIQRSTFKFKEGLLSGFDVDESQNIQEVVAAFKKNKAEKEARAEQERNEQIEKEERERSEAARLRAEEARAAQEKQAALTSMLITSGFNFDGYTITKYSGYISGDSAVSMDRPTQGWMGGVNKDVGGDLLAGLANIRRKALVELKEAAYALGCNAVIGVDFDYITLDPETATNAGGTLYLPFLFAVTANGNAVNIEKN